MWLVIEFTNETNLNVSNTKREMEDSQYKSHSLSLEANLIPFQFLGRTDPVECITMLTRECSSRLFRFCTSSDWILLVHGQSSWILLVEVWWDSPVDIELQSKRNRLHMECQKDQLSMHGSANVKFRIVKQLTRTPTKHHMWQLKNQAKSVILLGISKPSI